MNIQGREALRLPGIYSEECQFEEILPVLSDAIVEGKVLALRIAHQPPYGYVFRVDDRNLLYRVWKAKGRVAGSMEIDLSKKPVTSLSAQQINRYVNWRKLVEFGYNYEKVNKLLDLHVHTILPVTEEVPEHLVTVLPQGKTLAIIRFSPDEDMTKLVNSVSARDSKAIIGGTSLNVAGRRAYISTEELINEMSTLNEVDLFVLSRMPGGADLSLWAYHPMISLTDDGVRVMRKGIGYEELVGAVGDMGLQLGL